MHESTASEPWMADQWGNRQDLGKKTPCFVCSKHISSARKKQLKKFPEFSFFFSLPVSAEEWPGSGGIPLVADALGEVAAAAILQYLIIFYK